MNVLVTGGAGFLGLHLTEQLVAAGETVRVFSRRPHPRLAELGVAWQPGDLRDASAVDRACAAIDVVFHAAAIAGIWGPRELYYQTNVVGTRHVIEACRRHHVPKLIYTSSPSVVFDGTDHCGADESLPYATRFLCHYPETKAIAEREVLDANGPDGLSTVALRPHLIWGPRDTQLIPRLIARARSGKLIRIGRGDNLISMSYVENVATAHVQAAACLSANSPVAGQAYFINEPEPVSLWKWIDELLARAGLPPVRRSIPFGVAKALGEVFETAYATFGLGGEPPMTRFLAEQLAGSHYYSIERAVRDFGYRPIVTVEQGMSRIEPELRRLAGV